MTDALSQLPNNGDQKTTQDSGYTTEIMSEINDIEELSEGNFPIKFKTIDQYQQEEPNLMAKLKISKCKRGSVHRRSKIFCMKLFNRLPIHAQSAQ